MPLGCILFVHPILTFYSSFIPSATAASYICLNASSKIAPIARTASSSFLCPTTCKPTGMPAIKSGSSKRHVQRRSSENKREDLQRLYKFSSSAPLNSWGGTLASRAGTAFVTGTTIEGQSSVLNVSVYVAGLITSGERDTL